MPIRHHDVKTTSYQCICRGHDVKTTSYQPLCDRWWDVVLRSCACWATGKHSMFVCTLVLYIGFTHLLKASTINPCTGAIHMLVIGRQLADEY